jgi:hypothetical protein
MSILSTVSVADALLQRRVVEAYVGTEWKEEVV